MSKAMELERLPRSARRELLDFYDFLIQKYVATPHTAEKIATVKSSRRQRLQRIYEESQGKLPQDYRFNRDEAHER